jgi:small-conductance mechanosensitive channel
MREWGMAKSDANRRTGESAEPEAVKPLFGRWAWGSLLALGLLIVAGWVFLWRTDTADLLSLHRSGYGSGPSQAKTLVDESAWNTAKSVAALAMTQEELAYARQAERLADHLVDQAFATALRTATLQQKTLTGAAAEEQQRVKDLEAAMASDQASVEQLKAKGGDDLDLAQAQLTLDGDELADAREDLARASGDQRSQIQQELTARQADMKRFDAAQATGEAAVVSVNRYRTLAGLIGAWRKQNERHALLLSAKAAALQAAATFDTEHDKLEAQAKAAHSASDDNAAKRVAGLNHLDLLRQLMSIYDDRMESEQRLAAVYDKWASQVALQHGIVQRLVLVQVMWIAVILMLAILLNAAVRRITERELLDRRRMHTLSRILRLAIQLLTLVNILLVVFGMPSQLSTAVGLMTAGLTIALQDFILGFVGWFILMGKSGVAVGDVVEIDGVVGEAVEIGLFRTTMLETGNWTANGHPTGRRVSFNNKFAISGKFFNFSTAGQWMWDELTVTVPRDENTFAAVERVEAAVTSATHEDAAQAEKEWRQSSNSRGLTQFSAQPSVNLRPSGSNVDMVLRYVTRARGRFEQRNNLYQCVLDAVGAAK